jgi:hypothetical protein
MRCSWSRVRRHVTYANVTSTLAVFLLLAGGTAIAAKRLRANSVSSRVVRDSSLLSPDFADGLGASGADVADGSLSAADLAEGSLTGADVADGSLTGADLADGAVGAAQLGPGGIGKGALASNAVESGAIADGTIRGSDVGTDTITGLRVQGATLGTVPDAARFAGFRSTAFISADLEASETEVERGRDVGDGTFEIVKACPTGKSVLSGGPANVDPGSAITESSPVQGRWVVRINPHGTVDSFSVIVVCAVAST